MGFRSICACHPELASLVKALHAAECQPRLLPIHSSFNIWFGRLDLAHAKATLLQAQLEMLS